VHRAADLGRDELVVGVVARERPHDADVEALDADDVVALAGPAVVAEAVEEDVDELGDRRIAVTVGVELVDPGPSVDEVGRRRGAVVVAQGVVAVAAVQDVGALAAGELVVACAADQRVGRLLGAQVVVAVAAVERGRADAVARAGVWQLTGYSGSSCEQRSAGKAIALSSVKVTCWSSPSTTTKLRSPGAALKTSVSPT
jgi:hypothetical protein